MSTFAPLNMEEHDEDNVSSLEVPATTRIKRHKVLAVATLLAGCLLAFAAMQQSAGTMQASFFDSVDLYFGKSKPKKKNDKKKGNELGVPDVPGAVPVFYQGMNGSNCFRIPTIIMTHKGTLLAFAEDRHANCGDDDDHSLVLRRSTDLGQTWEPMQVVVPFGAPPCDGCPSAMANPNPVEVKFADGSYKILLHYETMNNPSAEKHGVMKEMWSDDEGITWGDSSVLNISGVANVGGLTGPSVGIQSTNGTIYFSARQPGGYTPRGNFLYWSKDYGKTWSASDQISDTSDESSVAFLKSPSEESVIMSVRNGKPKRGEVTFTDGGLKHGPYVSPTSQKLKDPNCQGSIINKNGVLYLSNLNIEKNPRSHLTVKNSTDQGATWSTGVAIWQGPSAYSQLVDLGDDGAKMGIIFEGGECSAYQTISFARIDAAGESAPPVKLTMDESAQCKDVKNANNKH